MEDKQFLKIKLNSAKSDFDRAFRELLFVADRLHREDAFDLSIKSRRARSDIEAALKDAAKKIEKT